MHLLVSVDRQNYVNKLFICIVLSMATANMNNEQEWFIGRVPPSRFEYGKLNGFHTPSRAVDICRNDIQCGGFTFRGPKNIQAAKVDIYFFHYVKDDTASLNTYREYPHWTTYIIGTRDYIILNGHYAPGLDHGEEIRNPYVFVSDL